MLLFIQRLKTKERRPLQFQYISCYSLSSSTIWNNSRASVSIHLMLLFILIVEILMSGALSSFNTSHVTLYHYNDIKIVTHDSFQYISCYSLSVMFLQYRFIRFCFNTSHVTLYPLSVEPVRHGIVFQYISCYSLSCGYMNKTIIIYKFQYISCYSLSEKALILKARTREFQYISCYSLSLTVSLPPSPLMCFNTSHVTLYPSFYRLFFF